MAGSRRKSQSSIEYLSIVALTFVIIVPTTYLFYTYSQESTDEISDSQLTKIGRNIIDTSESVYYSGLNSKAVIDFNLPDSVQSATIVEGRELVFNISTHFGISEIVFFSAINLTTDGTNCIAKVCSLPELWTGGRKKLKIEAINPSSVRINST